MQAKIKQEDLEKWADYLLDHSLGGIQKDDVVMLKGEYITWPLIQVLKTKIIQAGAVPDVFLVEPDNDRGQIWGAAMAKHGSMEQINRVPDWFKDRYENMTKYIEILGAESPDLFANLPDKKSAAIKKADMPFKEIRLSKPWILTLYPTKAFSDMENMSLEEYTDVVMSTTLTDPNKLEVDEQPIYEVMNESDTITIETVHPEEERDLKLSMSIKDRNIVKCTGKNNFPDGEVFTSPDANTVEGEIFVDLPVFFNGVNIRGIYLKIEDGKIVGYDAQENADTLSTIIETDKGSHRIGEVALGMNKGLQTALKHPLFVEKVGGTLHIAIGESYPECYVDDPNSEEGKQKIEELKDEGIVNSSAQHVDIVVDFREGGAGKSVKFDGREVTSTNNIWKVD